MKKYHPTGAMNDNFNVYGYTVAQPEDAAFDAMGKKLLAETDKPKLEKLTAEMNRYIHDQANVVFLYAPSKLYAVSNRVNFVPYKTWMLELAETTVK